MTRKGPGALLARAELGRADAGGLRLGGGAVAAGHEQLPAHGRRGGTGQRLGQMADNGRGVPGRVDGLDDVHRRAGVWTGDGLAAEHEDLPPERGDRRVAHRYRQRGDLGEGAAVGGGQHRGVRAGSVIAAHHVRDRADSDRHRVRTRRRHRPGGGGGRGARTAAQAAERERLHRGDSGRRPSPEDNSMLADHGHRGVVQGSAERTHLMDGPAGGANGVNPACRATAGGQPAEHDQPARWAGHGHLAADRGRQVPGHQACFSGRQATWRGHSVARCKGLPGRACRPAAEAGHIPGEHHAHAKGGEHDGEHRGRPPAAAPGRGPTPPGGRAARPVTAKGRCFHHADNARPRGAGPMQTILFCPPMAGATPRLETGAERSAPVT